MRAAVVLDHLVAAGAIPPTVGVFVDPGEGSEVVRTSERPADRALCGFSSGGSASFTAAWHRPDAFGRVVRWLWR